MHEACPRLTAVFLDRDGVINEKAPEGQYVTSWDAFRFLPGALEALRRLAQSPVRIFVVTNQRGIARGLMTEDDLAAIHGRMVEAIESAGGRIDAIYHCPHAGACDCRKPAPGMLQVAERQFSDVRLHESVVVGDRVHDMEAAAAVGALGVYVRGFDEPEPEVVYVANDLREAVSWLTDTAAQTSPPRAGSLHEDR